jgi:hypothetical protein
MSNYAGHRQHEGLMRQGQRRAIEGVRQCHTVASIPHYCKPDIDVVCYTGGLRSGTVTPVALECENLEVLTGVPAVLEQKTTICCKYLYLLTSLKDSPGLGGAYEDKPQRCGRKPCSWVKYSGRRGHNQGFSSTECVDEDLRFSPHPRPCKYGP